MILLCTAVGLLVLLMGLAMGIYRRLSRLERRLAGDLSCQESGDAVASAAETTGGGAFEEFLNEDPERRVLSKGEQFAAYRRWRKQHGKNWSNS